MVRGLEVFRRHFERYADQFILIGGTAATLAMEEAGLEFRATKDLDVVLHIEALEPAFGHAFWEFVAKGAVQEAQGLGVFVRSLVGLDRSAAKEALGSFVTDTTLSANQIEFVNLIVEHLTDHGIMDAARLYESPFTDVSPRGPDGLFSSPQIDQLIARLESVRKTAQVAAA